MEFFNKTGFYQLAFLFLINFFWTFLIARVLYYRNQRKPEYLFSLLLIGSIVFIIVYLLGEAKLSTAFAVGLFAIFAILRYRTNPIPVKDMTYFFIIIGISVGNAMANEKMSYVELFFGDLVIFLLTFACEYFLFRNKWVTKTIIIQNVELTRPENYTKLLEELTALSGYKVEKAEIGRVDYIKKQARIRIHYNAKDVPANFNDEGDNED
jgi:hypothetical protein